MTTLDDLKQTVKEAVKEEFTEIHGSDYPRDWLFELADSVVPMNNSEALEVAKSDLWLAVNEPELEFETPIDGIRWNILRELEMAALEEYEGLAEERGMEVEVF